MHIKSFGMLFCAHVLFLLSQLSGFIITDIVIVFCLCLDGGCGSWCPCEDPENQEEEEKERGEQFIYSIKENLSILQMVVIFIHH